MKRFSSFLIALSIGLAAPVSAWAQDYKIGFVNLDRILRDSTPAKAAQTRLENEFSKREKEIDDLAQQVKSASDKLVKDSAGSGLSESDKARRQRDLLDQDRELQRKRREFQEDFSQRKNEEISNLLERANRVVKQLFEQERYDLILQDPVFASPRLDITDKVIKALNNGSK